MVRKSRILVVLIAFLLVFSSSVSAAVPNKVENTKAKENQTTLQKLEKSEVDKQYKNTDIVRVIVEMKSDPTILYAQKQKKMYKELPEAKKKQLTNEKLAEQQAVKNQVKKNKVKLVEHENFTTVVNGFSADMMYGDIEKVKEIKNVSSVEVVNEYERPEEAPDMVYSKELVQAQEAWRDYGYKGNGMVVGVIDTGIDPGHQDMVLSDETEVDLTESKVDRIKRDSDLSGSYYTEKVPYAYNYMDENDTIQDVAPGANMHGMHVSGTVGANGNEDDGGIKGVAPEAQILGLKVFGNDPNFRSTYGDIYVKAIDDAIVLGADVLNMSLGSPASFVSPDSAEHKAVGRAVENGILMSISAGNSAHFGNGFANPTSENPDVGVVGAPGISYDSLQVASLENHFMDLDAVKVEFGGESSESPFLSAGSKHPNDVETKTFDVADGGLGYPEELSDVSGKYAMVQRGGLTFIEKAVNAQAAGAVGVIIFNNADGYVNMASDPSITIPQLFMLKNDGDKIVSAIRGGEKVTFTFEGEKTTAPNPEGGKMSDFTSWGVTPSLDFKPEITAPGGQIYSTLENGQYGMMSGTSMAAPHVAGGAALVLQRVDADFDLIGYDRVYTAKNIMMNTAQPVVDQGTVNSSLEWNLPYSPRRQGSGIMQLHSALSTPVVVTEVETDEAKVALKEVGNQFEFTLKAQNFSDEDVTYDAAANIQTDFAAYGELGWAVDELETQGLLNVNVTVDGQDSAEITVPAGGSVTFTVVADVSNAQVVDPSRTDDWTTPVDVDEVFPNGYFVEGYVTLTDSADTHPQLSVPYVGFKGNWDQAPILDGLKYDDDSFYGMAGAVYAENDSYNYLGYNPINEKFEADKIAISPNGDKVQEAFIPALTFLRNAKKVEFNIVDEDGKQLRKLRTENEVRKDYYDRGNGSYYKLNPSWKWDGKIKNKVAADGQYYFEIKSVIDFPDAEWQSVKIPVKIDTIAPEVAFDVVEDNTALSINAEDNEGGSGISYLDILIDGETVLDEPLAGDASEYAFGEELEVGSVVTVESYDFAGNKTAVEAEVTEVNHDKKAPEVYLDSPDALGTVNTNDVKFTGKVVDESDIDEFTIAGQDVELTYNEEKAEYTFDTTLHFEDGVPSFEVKAVDSAGNVSKFKRTIMVDATAPEVEVIGAPASEYIEHGADNPIVDVRVADNFDEIRFYLDGDELFFKEFQAPYEMRSFEHVIEEIELELKEGPNQFTFEATDLAGNKTVRTLDLFKLGEGETAPETGETPDGGKFNPNPVPEKPGKIIKPELPGGGGGIKAPAPSPTKPITTGNPGIGVKISL
ncbi:lactocepin [Cytobacillus horneckiae]|uniref:S8 family serine peptidase n=1 Tax=Cytobacillus horneckiae TaxID=549687 RepID=UPI0019CF8313|nr:S8 family serine peptidase [Cytobacillus horneckiae]MBN6885079.1 S8 family serine peptidase [Cytobacillus horneckiae]